MQKKIYIPQSHLAEIDDIKINKRRLAKMPAGRKAALFAIHCCYVGFYREKHKKTQREWFSISAKVLAKIAGDGGRWAAVRDQLCNAGFLEYDNECRPKAKCYGFKLGPKLREHATWKKEWNGEGPKPQELASNSTEWALEELEINLPPDERKTHSWLSIDKVKGHQIVDELAPFQENPKEWKQFWDRDVENFSSAYHFGSTGRICTDANLIKSELRDALLIDGETTVELDVRNSQPLLLTALLPEISPDRRAWQEKVEAGKIYDEFGECYGMDRKTAKEEHFMPFLFGGSSSPLRAYLKTFYPTVLKVIDAENLARNMQRWKGETVTKQCLAHRLQRMESEIIVGHVCGAFKAVSIHDGVRVKASEAEKVRAFIQLVFQSLYGLRPQIKKGEEVQPPFSKEELAAFNFPEIAPIGRAA